MRWSEWWVPLLFMPVTSVASMCNFVMLQSEFSSSWGSDSRSCLKMQVENDETKFCGFMDNFITWQSSYSSSVDVTTLHLSCTIHFFSCKPTFLTGRPLQPSPKSVPEQFRMNDSGVFGKLWCNAQKNCYQSCRLWERAKKIVCCT